MLDLKEEKCYGLSCIVPPDSSKKVLLLKLTDSSLKALEEFQQRSGKHYSSAAKRPTIQFQGTSGRISIPGAARGSTTAATATEFTFAVQPIQTPGSFECVKQSRVGASGHVDLQGEIRHRLKVNATDNVYQETRAKMVMVQEEKNKSSVVEIKPSSSIKRSKKVRIKRAPEGGGPVRPHGSKRDSGLGRPHRPTAAADSTKVNKVKGAPPTPAPAVARPAAAATRKPGGGGGGQNLPYRDRIVHILALKPYKKPELLLRLQREGVSERHRNKLGTILPQVASLRDNKYSLHRHLFHEVTHSWPGYSELERQQVKRTLAEFHRSSSASPLPSSGSRPNSLSPPKSLALDQSVGAKRRIAHSTRSSTMVSNIKSDAVNPSRLSPMEETVANGGLPAKRARLREAAAGPPAAAPPPAAGPRHQEKRGQVADNAARCNGKYGGDPSSPPLPPPLSSPSPPELDDYRRQYTPIVSREQRLRYKDHFNANYADYRALHAKVDGVTRRFAQLKEMLEEADEGSEQYQSIKARVIEEYRTIQKDYPNFSAERSRCHMLHGKLGHIKKLISSYDATQEHSAPLSQS